MNRGRARRLWKFLSVFASCAVASALCLADETAIFSIAFENDSFAGTDANYTHGTKVTYLHAERPLGDVENRWIERAPMEPERVRYDNEGSTYRWGVTVGQNMYTPENIAARDLVRNDRPYAGWLYGGLILQRRDSGERRIDTADQIEVNLGVVGPTSLADRTQRFVHRNLNAQRPNGWDHQLENELGVLIQYNRTWRLKLDELGRRVIPHPNFGVDVGAESGFGLGNVTTYANVGAFMRMGWHLPEHFNPATGSGGIRPSQLAVFSKDRRGGLFAFTSVNSRYIARNIFLDGNTWRESHSVNKKDLVADFRTGLGVRLSRDVTLLGWYAYRTREFESQRRGQRFGGVSLSYSF